MAVSGDGTTAVVGASGNETDVGTQAGSAYVYDLSGGAPVETKITASDGFSYDGFGGSVAVSGNGTTAVVGASGNDNNAGAVYVYDLSGGTPVETKLTASDGQVQDTFGYSVAVSGDSRNPRSTAFVGAPWDDTDAGSNAGSAYMFIRMNKPRR